MNYSGLQQGIKKAKRRVPVWWHHIPEEIRVDWIKHRRKTTKLCSCIGCGNQRRIDGASYQEKKWGIKADQEIAEI